MALQVETPNKCGARRWGQDSAEHSHGRRLPGTVVTQKPNNRSRLEVQINMIHCQKRTESLGQTTADDPSVVRGSPVMPLKYLHEVHQIPEECPYPA